MRAIFSLFIMLIFPLIILRGADATATNVSANQLFIAKTSVFNLTAIAAAKLALQRDLNNDLNTYARITIRSHEQANEVLAKLAQDKHLTMITGLTNEIDEKLAALEKTPNGNFLKSYLVFGLDNHNKALEHLEDSSAYNKDEDFRKHANFEIIRIHQHIQSVRLLEEKFLSEQKRLP